MPMYTKQTILRAKVETTPGTTTNPTLAANAIMAYDLTLDIPDPMKERNAGNSDFSPFSNVRGKTTVDLSFSAELVGSGTGGTAPNWGDLMQACGWDETASGTAVTYAPISSIKTCSITVDMGGICHQLVGCAGDFEIDLVSGEIPMVKYNFKGVYALPTDSAVSSPTLLTQVPAIVKGSTTTFGSYAAIIEKLNLKSNNTIVERTDFNKTEGVLSFMVSGRKPAGIMTCEAVLRATASADFWSYFDGGTSKALSATWGATGNLILITAPVCVLGAPKWGDRDGLRTFEVPFQMARSSSGNDELTIKFT